MYLVERKYVILNTGTQKKKKNKAEYVCMKTIDQCIDFQSYFQMSRDKKILRTQRCYLQFTKSAVFLLSTASRLSLLVLHLEYDVKDIHWIFAADAHSRWEQNITFSRKPHRANLFCKVVQESRNRCLLFQQRSNEGILSILGAKKGNPQ